MNISPGTLANTNWQTSKSLAQAHLHCSLYKWRRMNHLSQWLITHATQPRLEASAEAVAPFSEAEANVVALKEVDEVVSREPAQVSSKEEDRINIMINAEAEEVEVAGGLDGETTTSRSVTETLLLQFVLAG